MVKNSLKNYIYLKLFRSQVYISSSFCDTQFMFNFIISRLCSRDLVADPTFIPEK